MSQYPKNLTLSIINDEECEKFFKAKPKPGEKFTLDDGSICAGGVKGVDTCAGDGGSSLACPIENDQFILAGITSWGLRCNGGAPGVYTRISYFMDWINENVQSRGYNPKMFTIG